MRFLVFQHVDVEHPGIFRDFWREAGIGWDAVELDEGEAIPDLDPYDALIVMGGPMDVWQEEAHPWLAPEKAAIRRWVRDMERPYLGVCLGHQLLAEALGGAVGVARQAEVGLTDVRLTPAGLADPVLAGFAPTLQTFQWHGAEVQALPAGSTVLAANAACDVQAFRWGHAAYGVQFHVEITTDTVADWQAIPAYRASLEQALGEGASTRLAAATLERLPEFNAAARRFNTNFLSLVRASRMSLAR